MNTKLLPRNFMRRLAGSLLLALASPFAAIGAAADNARVTTALTPDGGRIILEARGVPPPAPFFFSASLEQIVRLSAAEITGEMRVKIHVVQGRPEVITLGLSGDGEVAEVSGSGLRDWSVRQGSGAASGKRFLDLRPLLPV